MLFVIHHTISFVEGSAQRMYKKTPFASSKFFAIIDRISSKTIRRLKHRISVLGTFYFFHLSISPCVDGDLRSYHWRWSQWLFWRVCLLWPSLVLTMTSIVWYASGRSVSSLREDNSRQIISIIRDIQILFSPTPASQIVFNLKSLITKLSSSNVKHFIFVWHN